MLHINLRHLRRKKQMSQQNFADVLGIPRTTYSEYEKGNTEPNLKMLGRMCEELNVSLDQLVNTDLTLDNLEVFRNKELRVLAMTVDMDGRSQIELVETKAEAGYMSGMADPEYISDLPRISVPSLQGGHYRAFEISGDSMLPMESGSIIISRLVESLKDIKDDKTYIIITHKDGVLYKRIRRVDTESQLIAISDNERYAPYPISYEDIQEIWQYHAHIGFSDVKQTFRTMLEDKIDDIYRKVNEIHAASRKKFEEK
ncbi:MAG TPA: LexA family transcriptional regulator [Saprospiraceae bacterium]|nr:LexA family transcriptional regulator [Saprospiraceae bacterium]